MAFFEQYDALLSPAERDLVATARGFCAGDFTAELHAAFLRDEPFDRRWITGWAALGMLGLQAKPEHGGHDASFLCKIRVAQEMARHGFAAAFCLNNLQGQVTRISQNGTAAQREQLLEPLCTGRLLAAPAMTEPQGGSDLGALATLARPVEGGWSLTGTKAWITNGTILDGMTVLARLEDGELASFFVLAGAAPAFTRQEIAVPGGRSFRLAELRMEGHVVPDWARLHQPGGALKAAMESVNAARVHVAAMAVASLQAGLAEAVRFSGARHAFGRPLLDHQGLRWELAEVALRLEAANALVFRAACAVNERRPAITLAAQSKKFAVDTALWGLDQCLRAMGAAGAAATCRIPMLLAETRLAAFGDGTNELLMDRIGRNLSRDYGEEAP